MVVIVKIMMMLIRIDISKVREKATCDHQNNQVTYVS